MSLAGQGFYSQSQYRASHGKRRPFVHWSWIHAQPRLPGNRPADPKDMREHWEEGGIAGTDSESLDMAASGFLAAHGTNPKEHGILFNTHVRERVRREIYNAHGKPEPGIIEGMYWRTHPSGRPTRDPSHSDRSFYK